MSPPMFIVNNRYGYHRKAWDEATICREPSIYHVLFQVLDSQDGTRTE